MPLACASASGYCHHRGPRPGEVGMGQLQPDTINLPTPSHLLLLAYGEQIAAGHLSPLAGLGLGLHMERVLLAHLMHLGTTATTEAVSSLRRSIRVLLPPPGTPSPPRPKEVSSQLESLSRGGRARPGPAGKNRPLLVGKARSTSAPWLPRPSENRVPPPCLCWTWTVMAPMGI